MFEGIVAECLNSSTANGTTKFGLCSRSFWFYWLIWWWRRNGNKVWHSENLSAVFANPQSSHYKRFFVKNMAVGATRKQRSSKTTFVRRNATSISDGTQQHSTIYTDLWIPGALYPASTATIWPIFSPVRSLQTRKWKRSSYAVLKYIYKYIFCCSSFLTFFWWRRPIKIK